MRNVVDILSPKDEDSATTLENHPIFFMKPGQTNNQAVKDASCDSSSGNQDNDFGDDNKQKTFRLKDIPDEEPKNCERYSKSSFYIMDEAYKYKKFFKQAHVAGALGVDNRAINKCLKGKQHMLHGLALAYAYEIESVDENGNMVLNFDKLKQKFSKNETYIVNRGGKCIKFNTPSEAAEKLNISKVSLLHCLLGKQPVTSGYKIFRAKDLEIKHPDGSITLDETKINEAKLEITSRAVYLVDEKEHYTRYDTQADAARAIDTSHGSIYACLNGKRKTIKGHIVMRANEVEKINKDGSYTIRFDKIKQALKASKEPAEPIDIRKNGFYAINRDMECKKFYSLKSTEDVLKVNLSAITACLKGITEAAGGYVYFRAEDIEIKDKDGTIKLDKAKIADKLSVFDGHPFYSIDKKGNCRRFNNQTEAAKALGIPSYIISRCLTGKSKASTEYAFVYAEGIEIKDKNGEISLNQELIDEKFNYLNKLALYVVDKNGNYERFSNRLEATNALEINKNTIGRYIDTQKTSDGYAYISALNVEKRLKDGGIFIDEEKIKALAELF